MRRRRELAKLSTKIIASLLVVGESDLPYDVLKSPRALKFNVSFWTALRPAGFLQLRKVFVIVEGVAAHASKAVQVPSHVSHQLVARLTHLCCQLLEG